MTASAPTASALTMSEPRRTPPSQITSTRSPTASTISGRRSNDAGAPSSWRPPWLETAMAVTPASAASRASATDWIPLRTSGPSQIERNHSRSRHERPGSNWDAMYSARSTAVDPSPPAAPWALANRIGSERRKRQVQPGWRKPSSNVPGPISGGRVNPRRTSRSRRPSTGASTVTQSASNPAAAARSTSPWTSDRSRHV